MRVIWQGMVAVLFTLFLTASGASAQGVCGSRNSIIDKLEQKYSEKIVAIGMANNGGIVQLLTSPKGKTWTIIITLPNEITCLLASGENWETVQGQFGVLI